MGQTWSKSDDKSWDLIINWMQLFSAVEVLGEIASRTKLTISLIVSLSPFLQCRSPSQADSGSFFLMALRVNCVSCLQTSSPEQISANGYSTINSLSSPPQDWKWKRDYVCWELELISFLIQTMRGGDILNTPGFLAYVRLSPLGQPGDESDFGMEYTSHLLLRVWAQLGICWKSPIVIGLCI